MEEIKLSEDQIVSALSELSSYDILCITKRALTENINLNRIFFDSEYERFSDIDAKVISVLTILNDY